MHSPFKPFGISAGKSAGPQLDLFRDARPPDYVLGPREVHPYCGDVSWTATWKGEYAGGINPCLEDPTKFEAFADLGYLLFGHGAGSTHKHYLGEFNTLEDAAAAHEKRTREVRADPTLIWSIHESKENIRKAKAKGWWPKKATA